MRKTNIRRERKNREMRVKVTQAKKKKNQKNEEKSDADRGRYSGRYRVRNSRWLISRVREI